MKRGFNEKSAHHSFPSPHLPLLPLFWRNSRLASYGPSLQHLIELGFGCHSRTPLGEVTQDMTAGLPGSESLNPLPQTKRQEDPEVAGQTKRSHEGSVGGHLWPIHMPPSGAKTAGHPVETQNGTGPDQKDVKMTSGGVLADVWGGLHLMTVGWFAINPGLHLKLQLPSQLLLHDSIIPLTGAITIGHLGDGTHFGIISGGGDHIPFDSHWIMEPPFRSLHVLHATRHVVPTGPVQTSFGGTKRPFDGGPIGWHTLTGTGMHWGTGFWLQEPLTPHVRTGDAPWGRVYPGKQLILHSWPQIPGVQVPVVKPYLISGGGQVYGWQKGGGDDQVPLAPHFDISGNPPTEPQEHENLQLNPTGTVKEHSAGDAAMPGGNFWGAQEMLMHDGTGWDQELSTWHTMVEFPTRAYPVLHEKEQKWSPIPAEMRRGWVVRYKKGV